MWHESCSAKPFKRFFFNSSDGSCFLDLTAGLSVVTTCHFHGHKVVTIDLKCCEQQIGTNFICYSKFHVDCYVFSLNNCYCAFCANICLWAEPGGYKCRVFPRQENGLDWWLTLGPPNLWECWSPAALSLHDHILSTSLSLLCVRAPYFASVVVMYPLRLLLWAKPAPHTHLVLSPGLQQWHLLSQRWHNHHGHPTRRCQTCSNTSKGIIFIATTGRHWTQTSLKNSYWENCLKTYLSTDKKSLTETVISFLKNLPAQELHCPPATPLLPEAAGVQEHPGAPPNCTVCNLLPKVKNLPGTARTASCREVIASLGCQWDGP